MLAFGDTSKTLDAVKSLSVEISAAADEGEAKRHLSPIVVDKLRKAGIFRMLVPKQYGGDSLSLPQACAVIEELAAADAAAAWTAMVALGFNVILASFPRETADKIYSEGPDVGLRGAIAPIGKFIPADGGYKVSGRWPFASGPYQPKWVVAGGTVLDGDKPMMGPMGPETRIAIVPADAAEFLDTWHTVGLRGTDSRDFQFSEAFVPEDHAINLFGLNGQCYGDSLFNLPFPVLAGPTHSAVCIGIVSAMLEELGVLARTKRSAFNPTQALGENPVFAHRFAELTVRHAALQALLEQQIREVTRLADEAISMQDVTRHASYSGYIHVQAVDIVNEAFTMAGSTPVYSKSSMQRRWRDIRVVAQHIAGSTWQYASFGTLLAGFEAPVPGK